MLRVTVDAVDSDAWIRIGEQIGVSIEEGGFLVVTYEDEKMVFAPGFWRTIYSERNIS